MGSVKTDEAKNKDSSQELLELALKVSKTGVWEWDVESNSLTWSPQLKKIYGLKVNEPVSYERYQEMIHPDDREHMRSLIKEAMSSGGHYKVEHRVVWPDGSVHWVLGQGQAFIKNGKAVRMVGTSVNIDERKDFERRLQDSEERFRTMADTTPVLIWMSGLDMGCTYFNKRWLDFTGRSLKQELGNGWVDCVHPEDKKRCLSTYRASFKARKQFAMEYRLRRHDGEYRWLLGGGAPRFSEDGEFLGYIGSCFDIHAIKTTEARKHELEEINSKLETQRRQLLALNRSKDEFISLASHQLRTPATGVKQYNGMMLEGFGGEMAEEQAHLLQVAYQSNERQLEIIDDLLKVAQVDADKVTLKRERTDLVALVNDIIRELSNKFKAKRQVVTVECKVRRVSVKIDKQKFRMALENIIENANKYTPEGKTITISLARSGRQIEVSVRDQGVGIAKKDIDKLFQKFSRVNNTMSTLVGGSGLGLYWAKRIILLHNGTIGVTSKLRRGSEFTITLPRG